MLPATATGVIRLLCQPGMESAWSSERRPTASFHAGFAPPGSDGYTLIANLPRPWQLVPEWGDWPYLVGWRHDDDRAVLVYCEGDLSVEVADDQPDYHDLLRRATQELAQSDEDATEFLRQLDRTRARSGDPLAADPEGAL